MKQVIHEPTRTTATSKSCIDLILTDSPASLVTSGTRDKLSDSCDHHPIYAHIKIQQPKQQSYKRMVWLYNQGDYETFNQLLLNAPWWSCYVEGDVDTTTEKWMALFLQCADMCIPHYEATIRPRDKPFMTSEIRRLMRHRDSLHKRAKTSQDPVIIRELKNYRNRVVSEIRKEKKIAEEDTDRSLSAGVGSKKWWKAYKNATGTTSSQMGPLSDSDGRLFTSGQEKAELLNQHFAAQTQIHGDASTLPPLNVTHDNRIDPLVVLPEHVYNILRHLNPDKATGSDGIGNRLLREAAVSIAQPLAELMNYCLSLSRFPSCWKIAQVVPLFKKGDRLACNNYRPISLLPCISKVFEKILFDHVFEFLKANDILTSNRGLSQETVQPTNFSRYVITLQSTWMKVMKSSQSSWTSPRLLIGCGTRAYCTSFNKLASKANYTDCCLHTLGIACNTSLWKVQSLALCSCMQASLKAAF
jgi:hypothetical protein